MSILKLPQYYLWLPGKIKKILLYRFLFATLLCSLLDYQMLTIFVSINLFEVRRPLVSLTEILRWTLFSVYSPVLMLLIRLSMMGFGLVLCHIHYVYPRCYRYNLSRLTYKFPIRFCLISSILSITIASSWLYASFVDLNNGNHLLKGSWCYHMTFGCFCGISYYHKYHKICLQRFPLPIVHLNITKCVLQSWCQQLKSSAKTALVPTLLFALIYWSTMGFLETRELGGVSTGCFVIITQPQRLFQAWLLATLILAKLHIVRKLYGLIMQQKLTLICDLREVHEHIDINVFNLIWARFQYFFCMMRRKPMPMSVRRNNLSLPIAMALDTGEIYGFQLLAARDFYAAMSGSLCIGLFEKQFCQRNRYWEELRDVILGMLDQFLARMESCLEPTPRIKVCHLLKNKNSNDPRIRSLVKKPPPRRLCALWRAPPSCQTPQHTWCSCNLSKYLYNRIHSIGNGLWLRLSVASQYYSFFYEVDPLDKLNYELRCGEPLVWILQGLVSICVRFPHEDKIGCPLRDLERILVYLLRVEEKLIAAKEMQVRGKLCSSHDHLMMATSRCLYKMLFTFGPQLDYIFDDVQLRAFKRRMELIP